MEELEAKRNSIEQKNLLILKMAAFKGSSEHGDSRDGHVATGGEETEGGECLLTHSSTSTRTTQ
jgi:hypothetical protein